MRWASAVSEAPASGAAAAEAAAALRGALGGAEPDLLFAFVSAHHENAFASAAERIAGEFRRALLVGCSAWSVIGDGREIEQGPGLALCGAHLPGVQLHPLHLEPGARAAPTLPPESDFVLLADPFTSDVESLIQRLDARFPGRTKIGGLVSGASQPGRHCLLLGTHVLRSGCVGVALDGNVRLEPLVAQGCRPVGQPLFVTRCQGNLICELDGRRPTELLAALYAAADERERALFRGSLFLGIEMRPAQQEYGRGDYLIRNLLGAESETGALRVAAPIRERQVVQFHLRDARAADEDLARCLARRPTGSPDPAGLLLFSCLGRGRELYGVPDHDTGALRRSLGEVPIGGFFCNGEIGPVEGRTFLHGYTSACALFHPAECEEGGVATR